MKEFLYLIYKKALSLEQIVLQERFAKSFKAIWIQTLYSSRIYHKSLLFFSKTKRYFNDRRSLQKDQFQIYDLRESDDKAIKLKFGQNEKDNLSRYVKADMHKNGYMVACGGQETAKVNFWDLRYCGVSSRVSFSVDVPKTPKILVSMFIPGQDTMVTASSTRYMNWLDYSVRNDEIIKEFE